MTFTPELIIPARRFKSARANSRRTVELWGKYIFLVAVAIYFLLPVMLIVLNSVKPMEEIRQGMLLGFPSKPTLDAWREAWSSACTGLDCDGVRPGFVNSVAITVPAVVSSCLLGAVNGFALSQWRSRTANIVLFMVMIGLFIPYQAMLYPTVKILSFFQLFGNYWGIVAVHIIFGLPFTSLLFRNFYVGVSKELTNAARMEGAGFLRTFWSIMLPLSKNILIVVGLLQFTAIWNEYLLGFIFAGKDSAPMTVQLNNIVNNTRGASSLNVNMAATLITALPPLIVYFLSGRYFVQGIAAGAVKG
ncbi:carbohydrate ABC transporter permease [Mesorhizobium sp. 10J20-29]